MYDVNGDGRADFKTVHEAHAAGYKSGLTGVRANHATGDPARNSSSSSSSSGSSSSGSKVICTYFYQRGELDENLYFADIESAKHLIHPVTVRGYHLWGIPYVRHLRAHPGGLLERLIRPVVLHRANEIGFQMGIRARPDYLGKLFRLILEPPCFVVGMLAPQADWRQLYSPSEFHAFAQGFRRYHAFKSSLRSI